MPTALATASPTYQRHRPETTAPYEVVRDNLETLEAAICDGALAVRIPEHARSGRRGARSGAVAVVQRTSSDMRLHPHLHLIVLDGTWVAEGGELVWEGLSHLRTREVGEVLERCVGRISRYLRRHRLLSLEEDEGSEEGNLAASAVSGQAPPAGPQWRIGLAPLRPQALAYDKPRCAALCGFTLHADTTAGAADPEGREALLRHVLRPPLGNQRLELRPDGLVRISLNKAFADGTVAVEMDPLSLLCRLATSVPPPRLHTITYAGVLASASAWRRRLAPGPDPEHSAAPRKRTLSYRTWADLLARTFAIDSLECPRCKGRMRLIAMITRKASIERYLTAPRRADRGPLSLTRPGSALLEEPGPAPSRGWRSGQRRALPGVRERVVEGTLGAPRCPCRVPGAARTRSSPGSNRQ